MFPALTNNPERYIHACQNCSQANTDVHGVIASITRETTPAQFDAIRAGAPGYAFEQGGLGGENALCRAAKVGNVALIQHIVTVGGRALLNLGNLFGETPLFLAVRERHADFQTALTLLRLGADPNLASRIVVTGDGGRRTHNPLWEAVVHTHDYAMQDFLMAYGAKIDKRALKQVQPESVVALDARDADLRRKEDALAAVDALAKMPRELIHFVNEFGSTAY